MRIELDHVTKRYGKVTALDGERVSLLQRRLIEIEAGVIVDQRVARHDDVAGVLEADTHAGGATRIDDDVAIEHNVVAVHDEHAHHVAVVAIVRDPVVVAVHQMGAVAPARDLVTCDPVATRVPHDHIAAALDVVVLDDRVLDLPQPDRVAAQTDGGVEPTFDPVAADRRMCDALGEHAEHGVDDRRALDPRTVAREPHTGVGAVEHAAAAVDRGAEHPGIGRELDHRAARGPIDHGVGRAPHNRARSHADRPVVSALREAQPSARLGGRGSQLVAGGDPPAVVQRGRRRRRARYRRGRCAACRHQEREPGVHRHFAAVWVLGATMK